VALLTIELGDREIDRLGYREVQSSQHSESTQQLDHRGHLDRMTPLSPLDSRLTYASLAGHLGLRPVALEPVALQPAAELGEDRRVSSDFIQIHQF
jgi:hypothetical protein